MDTVSNKKTHYKNSRKYKCPFCDLKDNRSNLVDHVEKKHQDLIPEDYSAARCVYDYINGKNYGICMICKNKVYKWNPKVNKYYNLCDKAECRNKVREIALERHVRVYGKETLLNDPEQQEKMLANRKISGVYTFSDGGKVTYTGKYEKNALEFLDKVLEIPSRDIQSPGPVLDYEYKGKTHKYISDIYYIPANLLIEVKDGGSNPNKRKMDEYREKQTAKEEMITSLGKFNYLRLTDNDFSQILDVLADIKNEEINPDSMNPKVKIHINEEVGGLPPNRPPEAYIIPYGMNNVFDGFAYSDTDTDGVYIPDETGTISLIDKDLFYQEFSVSIPLVYCADDSADKISIIKNDIKNNSKISNTYFAEVFVGHPVRYMKDVLYDTNFRYYDESEEKTICHLIENTIDVDMNNAISSDNTGLIECDKYVFIRNCNKGYYASTPKDFYMCSDYYESLESLKNSGIVDLMNNIYLSNSKVVKSNEDEEEDIDE